MTSNSDAKAGVLILQYDTSNKYGTEAAERVRKQLRKQKGFVELSQDAFIINVAESFTFLTRFMLLEDRRFVGVAERHLHLALVLCQSPIVAILPEVEKKKLAEFGLDCWEIGYPEEQREVDR